MSSHATNSPSPATLMSISANNLSALACGDATSSEHQSSTASIPGLFCFFFTPLDYRCQPQARTAIGTNEPRDILAFSSLRPQRISPTTHCSPLLSDTKDGLENSVLSPYICIFFLCEHTLIILILHPIPHQAAQVSEERICCLILPTQGNHM